MAVGGGDGGGAGARVPVVGGPLAVETCGAARRACFGWSANQASTCAGTVVAEGDALSGISGGRGTSARQSRKRNEMSGAAQGPLAGDAAARDRQRQRGLCETRVRRPTLRVTFWVGSNLPLSS